MGNLGIVVLVLLSAASAAATVTIEPRELKPGEALETWIISAADEDLGRVKPPLTWVLRLRTGINRTDVVGVRVGDAPGRHHKDRDRRPSP